MTNDGTSSDDIIDERIRALAVGQFNAPEGEPPRDAMWNAIASARRAARAAGAREEPAIVPIAPIAARRSHAAAWRWGAALAAGLVLGVMVDRAFVRPEPSSVGAVAVQPSAPSPAPDRAIDSVPPSTPAAPSPRATPSAPSVRTPDGITNRRTDLAVVPRDTAPGASRAVAVAPRSIESTTQALYRTAAAQTLVQAEALLTAYRADEGARDPLAMQQAARWARDVLSSTRLLIDSPAGRDPQMRALFTDLELILAQLVQLSGTPLQASERELIERAMRERDLLPRLRSAVPAGLAAS
jgi:hypothetical protein